MFVNFQTMNIKNFCVQQIAYKLLNEGNGFVVSASFMSLNVFLLHYNCSKLLDS